MGRLRNPAAGPQINATAKVSGVVQAGAPQTLASPASRIEVEGETLLETKEERSEKRFSASPCRSAMKPARAYYFSQKYLLPRTWSDLYLLYRQKHLGRGPRLTLSINYSVLNFLVLG